MENQLKTLDFQELVALEKMIDVVCEKYENIAQMNRYSTSPIDVADSNRATNSLTYFNNKRSQVLEEMERRIKHIGDEKSDT